MVCLRAQPGGRRRAACARAGGCPLFARRARVLPPPRKRLSAARTRRAAPCRCCSRGARVALAPAHAGSLPPSRPWDIRRAPPGEPIRARFHLPYAVIPDTVPRSTRVPSSGVMSINPVQVYRTAGKRLGVTWNRRRRGSGESVRAGDGRRA